MFFEYQASILKMENGYYKDHFSFVNSGDEFDLKLCKCAPLKLYADTPISIKEQFPFTIPMIPQDAS